MKATYLLLLFSVLTFSAFAQKPTKEQKESLQAAQKKQNETLAKLMSDLLKEIQKMKFTTNTGSTIKLVNQPQFLAIENRFKDFLKES